jgi:type IV pilus assembly protein PilO
VKITQREKTLLVFLGIVVIIAISYFLLFKPQFDKLASLASEKAELELEVERANKELDSGAQLDANLAELKAELTEKTKKYYPEIMQDQIIILINQLINKTAISSDSLNFSPVVIKNITNPSAASQEIGDYELYKLAQDYRSISSEKDAEDDTDIPDADGANGETEQADAGEQRQGTQELQSQISSLQLSMNFRGSYAQIMSFIREIEDLDRSILVNSFSMAKDQDDLISADIQLEFIALPKLQDTDSEYLNWPYNNRYGKTNPFQ